MLVEAVVPTGTGGVSGCSGKLSAKPKLGTGGQAECGLSATKRHQDVPPIYHFSLIHSVLGMNTPVF